MPDKHAVIDPITGFLDRRSCLHAAHRMLAAAESTRQPLAALWIDLDRFRQINASFGHAAGDEVIARVAGRIRMVLPSGGHLLARMGSDEFVVMLRGEDRPVAEAFGRLLLVTIEQSLCIDEILIHPSASIGVALLQAGDDALSLLERADRAMGEAKRQGGGRLEMAAGEVLPGYHGVSLAREELAIEADLHAALDSGGLSLEYQPIVSRDGRVEAVEALMRCKVFGRNLTPDRFIPVAEKSGLIIRLGEWSLLQGARFAARLRDEGRPTKVAINVSRAQLTSPEFLPALHGALLCADISAELLELELTESLAMELADVVQDNLRRVREAGVGLAIDDFGTGFSSLSSLKDLPATKLKLDKSFIQVLPEDRRALAVVKAATRMGRELGMVVVAEGVETDAQRQCLEEAGVDALQGFALARPMPEDLLLNWLKQRNSP
ncbi:putative bifunctional diguanylate cyclase/phosphodiesterase [Zoogloea sp.]|uniref:putative bifunctional diguanylate cyclase/phosphodiesterase n=1 Tax=Zoogloea sp. TaxID=49181 RepID=UPI0035AD79F1